MSVATIAGPAAEAPVTTFDFLQRLYRGSTYGQLTVFTLPEKRTYRFPVDDLESAAGLALELDTNVYYGICLQDPASRGRGSERTACVVPGFWLDVDILDPEAHHQEALPASIADAQGFLGELELPPTIIVHSGHGLQAYWLFDEPWILDGDEEKDQAKQASHSWQNNILRLAADRGWKLDNTADLARVFRVPGTRNYKTAPPVPVRILSDAGATYPRGALVLSSGSDSKAPETLSHPEPTELLRIIDLAAPGGEAERLEYTEHVLKAISNDDRFDRSRWVGVAHAIRAALAPGLIDEGRHLFDEWSEGWTCGDSDPGEAERVFDSLPRSTNPGGYPYLVSLAGPSYELPSGHPWGSGGSGASGAGSGLLAVVMNKVKRATDLALHHPDFLPSVEDALEWLERLPLPAEQALARGALLRSLEPSLGRSASQFISTVQASMGQNLEQPFKSLAELLEDPELLRPPEAVVPRLAFVGRTTLLAGPDKSGKSTLMAHAAAALSRHLTFLGGESQGVHDGRVLWVGLEEAVGDAVRRFHQLDADPEKIDLICHADGNVLQAVREQLLAKAADLVVIDSLTELARLERGEGPKSGDDAAWAAVMRPLVKISRDFGVAIVILHHVRKSDQQYRGSTEIAAAVDALFELTPPSGAEDPNLRRIRGRGRTGMWTEPFSVLLGPEGYEVAVEGELPLEVHIVSHVQNNPGISLSKLQNAVGVRFQTVRESVMKLLKAGEIENRGTGSRWALHPAPAGEEFMHADVELSLDGGRPNDDGQGCPVHLS